MELFTTPKNSLAIFRHTHNFSIIIVSPPHTNTYLSLMMTVIFHPSTERKGNFRGLLLKATQLPGFALRLLWMGLASLVAQCVVCLVPNFSPPDCVLFDFHHLLLNRYFKSPHFRAIWEWQKRNGKKVESRFCHRHCKREGSRKGKECVAIFRPTFRLMLASFLSSE